MRADAEAALHASLLRPQPRPGDRARREAEGDRAGADVEGVLLPPRARRRTTPRSSSSGTSTTRSAGRRRRRSSRACKAYHGVTVASASLTGLPANHADFDLPIANILHTSCPHHYRFAQDGESEEEFSTRLAPELEELIQREGPDTVAAFIAEPVMGAGGAIMPPAGYFEKIQAVCDRHDVLFIADEVITGFGRLGTMLGLAGLRHPARHDLLRQGRDLGLSAARRRDGERGRSTRRCSTRAARSALFGARLHLFGPPGRLRGRAEDDRDLRARPDRRAGRGSKAPLFQRRLAALADHPLVGEARGMGLIGGLEIVADKAHEARNTSRSRASPRNASASRKPRA